MIVNLNLAALGRHEAADVIQNPTINDRVGRVGLRRTQKLGTLPLHVAQGALGRRQRDGVSTDSGSLGLCLRSMTD